MLWIVALALAAWLAAGATSIKLGKVDHHWGAYVGCLIWGPIVLAVMLHDRMYPEGTQRLND